MKIGNKCRVSANFSKGSETGFTIVELMVAMVISLIVMASIYSVYHSQQKSYMLQEQVTMMQQNLRAGMTMMTRDIRMAGFKPPLPPKADGTPHDLTGESVGIQTAEASKIVFKRLNDAHDADDNLNPNDYMLVEYSLLDHGSDGDNDMVRKEDSSATVGSYQLMAENIDALNFVYLKEDGTVLAAPVDAANLSSIRSIQVTMVAMTGRGDQGYTDANVYKNQQGDTLDTNNDNNRRRLLTRTIQCRNL